MPTSSATATALRVLVVVQALVVLAGAVQAVHVTVHAASRTHQDTLEGLFYGAGTFIVGALAFLALLVVALLAGLAAGLRNRPPRRHVGVLVALGIVEVVVLVPAAPLAVAALTDPVDLEVAAVPGLVTLAAVAVGVLALVPGTRRWAAGPAAPPFPGPYPGYPVR